MENLVLDAVELTLNRKKGRYTLTIGESVFEQNVCEFLLTFSFLNGKNVEELLLSTDSCYDEVRVPLTCCGKCVTLELGQFVAFREVYAQEMFRLKLEDQLVRRGIGPALYF